jgi:hypothetical protein
LVRPRIATAAIAVALALGLAACGQEAHPNFASSNNNGEYVDAGPISYQLQISRELNQYSTEDSQYVQGIPSGSAPPGAAELWFGVFLWAKNQTDQPQTTTNTFDIVDTTRQHYYPIPLAPALNPYAWSKAMLPASGTYPPPNTTAYYGPTQGGLLLFRLPTTIYSNRPLLLEIYAPGQSKPARISLDL